MPRSGPPRSGVESTAWPRRAPMPHGLTSVGGIAARHPTPAGARGALRLVPLERAAVFMRRPVRPTTAARPTTVATAAPPARSAPIPLGGPSVCERARRLRAAYDASAHDDVQRQLLAEIMTHFRAWCEAHALGDPFGRRATRALPNGLA